MCIRDSSNHLVNLAIRTSQKKYNYNIGVDFEPQKSVSHSLLSDAPEVQSPNQKIPDRKTKCVIKTHINIKQNVIFGAKLKPV